ncbi:hypothetical protein [Muricoccus nepalensis]|uniref:hypothetical protein n=1 Tax=Muricoccus nepalensis TaxID=1854500 RepID=UPI001F504234|nr:hypothetical protein [Roseomonas nepalensis]
MDGSDGKAPGGPEAGGPAEGTEAPDLARLAADWISLWQGEMAAMATDPALLAACAGAATSWARPWTEAARASGVPNPWSAPGTGWPAAALNLPWAPPWPSPAGPPSWPSPWPAPWQPPSWPPGWPQGWAPPGWAPPGWPPQPPAGPPPSPSWSFPSWPPPGWPAPPPSPPGWPSPWPGPPAAEGRPPGSPPPDAAPPEPPHEPSPRAAPAAGAPDAGPGPRLAVAGLDPLRPDAGDGALRARLDALERELAGLRAALARGEGGAPADPARPPRRR